MQAYELVQGPLVRWSEQQSGQRPPPTAVMVHGILGSRKNMHAYARRLVEVCLSLSKHRHLRERMTQSSVKALHFCHKWFHLEDLHICHKGCNGLKKTRCIIMMFGVMLCASSFLFWLPLWGLSATGCSDRS